MKVGAINEMTPAYRELKPIDTKELELNVQKSGAVSPAKEAQKTQAEKKIIDDGRETIGVSNDGDIARASKEALENASEGIVLKKSQEKTTVPENTAAPKAVREPANRPDDGAVNETQSRAGEESGEKASKDVGSLLSYSKNELERLYLQGEINSNQLDKELERREEVRGEKTEAYQKVIEDEIEEKKTNENVAAYMENKREYGVEQVTARDNKVEKADKEASDRRMEAIKQERQTDRTKEADKKDEAEAAEENRKRIITEEMALDESFDREMSVLSGAETQDKITSDALDTAVENGRLKIMEQIMGYDPATASNV